MSAHLQPGQIAVTEHKTSSLDIAPGSVFWKKLVLDSQASNYHVGARAIGVEPVGIVYDVIRKVGLEPYVATPMEDRAYTQPKSKACPVCKKKNGPPAPHTVDGLTCDDGRITTDPGGRLYAKMRENDETLDEYRERVRADIASNPEKYYQRGLIVRTHADEHDAALDAWTTGRQIRESQLSGSWPRNTDACHQFNSECDYWRVCSREASIEDDGKFRTLDREHEELAGDATNTVDIDAPVPQTDGAPAATARKRLPVLSTSSAKAYRKCPTFYLYAYELRRRPLRSSPALRFGTLIHRGLEVWWNTVDVVQAIHAMRGATELDIDPIDLIRAEELMLGYHVRWHRERLNVLHVEKEFTAPLVNPTTGQASRTWVRGGKMDAVVQAAEAAEESAAAE